ncbi:MAG: isoleucine-tRNA ligase [Claussenomyces sp. TS43310]|nr:MAG: isoleucine-tRNA ligase [Claussenomyces sp. TS43310]
MPANPAKSWSSTLRLPKSTFPPRPSVVDRAKYLKRCTDDLYEWQAQSRNDQKPFVLHDGPPYANGSLHCGHAINKVLKDMVCRAELHQGRRVQFVPGWDCHGLPIEVKALELHRAKSGHDETKLDSIGIRRAARALATKTIKEQKKSFGEWAVMADWENAWKTMDKTFEMKQLGVFQEMVKRGLIFRRNKPVYWSPSSRTALAEAELEYKDDHESTAAYIKFPIVSIPEALQQKGVDLRNLSAVIWTTTPWTLPANRAIAVHDDLEYTIVKSGKQQFLIAKSRVSSIAKLIDLGDPAEAIVKSIRGSELQGATYANCLRGQGSPEQPIISANFVSAESGSGLVHCAPGHGMEDYDVCTRQGMPASAPVDDAGCFTDAALPDDPAQLTGLSVLHGGSSKVLQLLGEHVLKIHKYKHKYPYDWRTKLPVIVRATEQWFADVGIIKEDALEALTKVKFIPETGRARLESFVKGRSEWCISRQRAWGVPIPALYDEKGKAVLTDASVAHIISVIGDRGIDAWWTDAHDDPAWIVPGLQGEFRRGTDTMDVWFDSGSSWTQTPEQADVYSEGSDQHRGWFQSSLLTHICASGESKAPFKTLITHGFTLDQEGRKMSKSIGNVIAPSQIMDGSLLPPVNRKGNAAGTTSFDGLGADALRLWVASSDYTRDVVISQPVLKAVHTSLLKYRTTVKMLLGSMQQPSTNLPPTKLDLVALYHLETAMKQVQAAWEAYEFHKAVSIINRWVNVDLSSFYLEAIKDRIYCGDGGGILHVAYQGLLQMLSPVTPVLVEEAWEHRPAWMKEAGEDYKHPLRVTIGHDMPWTTGSHAAITEAVNVVEDLPWLLNANAAIKTAQEEARGRKLIGSSLQSAVVLLLPDEAKALFDKWRDELEAIYVVSSVKLNTDATAAAIEDPAWQFSADFDTPGGRGRAIVMLPEQAKCPRCWRYVAPAEDELCHRCQDVVAVAGGESK